MTEWGKIGVGIKQRKLTRAPNSKLLTIGSDGRIPLKDLLN
jgi:hypothetical protein